MDGNLCFDAPAAAKVAGELPAYKYTRERIDGCLHARIPALLGNGSLAAAAGVKLDPQRSRVMICGNPDRVDDIRRHLGSAACAVSRRGQPAQMAVENDW